MHRVATTALASMMAIWVLAFSIATPAHAQSVSTEISSRAISTQERLTYSVEAEGKVQEVTPPSNSDFEIVGQSKHTSINFINGKTTRKLTVSYQLAPTRAGDLDTGAATVRLKDGRNVKAERYTIKVSDAGPPAARAHSPRQQAQPTQRPSSSWFPDPTRSLKSPAARAFGEYPPLPLPASSRLFTQDDGVPASDRPFLLAFTNTKNPVIGEPFLVEYLYYEPLTAIGFEAHDMDEPEFPQSWFKDISEVRLANQHRIMRVRHHGQTYNVQIVRSYMVVPLQEGTYVVPPFQLTIAGHTFTQRLEPFDIQSPSMNIEVEALPRKGRPPHSKDNVGRYHMEATLQPEEARIGDTFHLDLQVTGVGVPAHVHLPSVALPDGLHLLSPIERAESQVNSIGWLETKKHKSISFQATKEGDYQLPPIAFHWYDPWEKAWKTDETEAFTLRVQGVAPSAKQPQSPESTDEEETPQSWVRELLTGENTPEKKGVIAKMRQRGEPWRGAPLYFIFLFAPLVGFIGIIVFTHTRRRRQKTREERLKISAKAIAKRALKRCSPAELESFIRMDQIMRRYLRASGIPGTRGATYKELRAALTDTRNQQSADHLISLLQALEEARYGGADPVRFHALRNKLLQWLKEDTIKDDPADRDTVTAHASNTTPAESV